MTLSMRYLPNYQDFNIISPYTERQPMHTLSRST